MSSVFTSEVIFIGGVLFGSIVLYVWNRFASVDDAHELDMYESYMEGVERGAEIARLETNTEQADSFRYGYDSGYRHGVDSERFWAAEADKQDEALHMNAGFNMGRKSCPCPFCTGEVFIDHHGMVGHTQTEVDAFNRDPERGI